jgi:hemolysin-activating ACP:hemolysin acyltransferase
MILIRGDSLAVILRGCIRTLIKSRLTRKIDKRHHLFNNTIMYEHMDVPPSPEAEFAITQMLDEARDLLASTKKARILPEYENEAGPVVQLCYGRDDTTPVSCLTAAFYSNSKDKTVVINASYIEVAGEVKTGLCLYFYDGAPFGHVYTESDAGTQFIAKPGAPRAKKMPPEEEQRTRSMLHNIERDPNAEQPDHKIAALFLRAVLQCSGTVEPLQRIDAVWDPKTSTYPYIESPKKSNVDDDEFSIGDVASMRVWIRDADVPLDIM